MHQKIIGAGQRPSRAVKKGERLALWEHLGAPQGGRGPWPQRGGARGWGDFRLPFSKMVNNWSEFKLMVAAGGPLQEIQIPSSDDGDCRCRQEVIDKSGHRKWKLKELNLHLAKLLELTLGENENHSLRHWAGTQAPLVCLSSAQISQKCLWSKLYIMRHYAGIINAFK